MHRTRRSANRTIVVRNDNSRQSTYEFLSLLPNFSGTGELSVKQFLGKVREISKLSNWSDAEKITITKLKLTDAAAAYVNSEQRINENTTFEDISQLLIRRFEKHIPIASHLQNFSSCKQKENESVKEFASRLSQHASNILSFNGAPSAEVMQAHDLMVQAKFTAGLWPKIQRFVLSQSPTSFQNAVDIAVSEEINEKIFENSQSQSNSENDKIINLLVHEIQNLNSSIKDMQATSSVNSFRNWVPQRGQNERRPRACYYCGRNNHLVKDCWRKKKDEEESQFHTSRRERDDRPTGNLNSQRDLQNRRQNRGSRW